MEWDKTRLIEFLEQHDRQKIIVEESGGAVSLRGILRYHGERDMCGRSLYEASMITEIKGIEISLTLHNDFLGIHLLARSAGGDESLLSYPAQIPYKKLSISLC